jgi:signal transduction histidine kinase
MSDTTAPSAGGSSEFFRELDIQLLAHELKSPLSLIEASTRTLLEQTSRLGPLTGRQQRTLKRILRSAARGRRMVHLLLEIGGAEAGQLASATFDPIESVQRVLVESIESSDAELADQLSATSTSDEQLAVLARAGIRFDVAPGLGSLCQDQVKFELVVGNLIQNALRFRQETMEVALSREGDDLVVSVKDDGPGIAPEHHSAIFERYKQVSAGVGLAREGHGLGLAGAVNLARHLGGDISLDSVPGHGATFRVRIPSGHVRAEAS